MLKKKIGFLIFARSSSTRLPNKVLKKINTKPILWYVFKRVLLISRLKKNIIIVTSKHKSDDKIINFCTKNNLKSFRGPLNNVMKRSLDCANFFNLDFFMRICADRPFLDYSIGRKMLKLSYYKYDLVTNNFPKTFPKGQGVEIIKSKVFQRVFKNIKSKKDLEHVFPYFYRNRNKFKFRNIRCKQKLNTINLSIDTLNDLIRIRKLLTKSKNVTPSLDKLLNKNIKLY